MTNLYPGWIAKCGEHMHHLGIDVRLLSEANGFETLMEYRRPPGRANHIVEQLFFQPKETK